MRKASTRFLLGLTLLCAAHPAEAFQTDTLWVLHPDSLGAGGEVFFGEAFFPNLDWRFCAEDDPRHAAVEFDDSACSAQDPRLTYDATPEAWSGMGWFRSRFTAHPAILHVPLSLFLYQTGAAEIYLDGELILRTGRVHHDPDEVVYERRLAPYIFEISEPGPHVFAVRYANHHIDAFHDAGTLGGFELGLASANRSTEAHLKTTRLVSGFQLFFMGTFAAFALLHGALFFFFRESKENLYFAILMVAMFVVAYLIHQSYFESDPTIYHLLYAPLWRTVPILFFMFLVLFVYSLFYKEAPRQFYIAAAVALALILLSFTLDDQQVAYVLAFCIVATTFELMRVVIAALIRGKPGARTVGLGVALLCSSFVYLLLVAAGRLTYVPVISSAIPFFGALALAVTMSVHLSMKVARMNNRLREQIRRIRHLSEQRLAQERKAREEEVRIQSLEAENLRQTEELEGARTLQLSMLPETLPDHPDLDIAAFMQTATEVGGDYYDFHVSPDGILTMAIGDATGHGMKAGTMVTATKSLFNALHDDDLLGIFDRSTRALKEMKLHRLYMSLTLARYHDDRLQIAAAGMPPSLIYRKATHTVEPLVIKGMPLGSFPDFPYEEQTIVFGPGDVALFMSDGFAELSNEHGERLGYHTSEAMLAETAHKSAQQIIQHLLNRGQAWRNGSPTSDDITFVVLKRKALAHTVTG